LSHVTDETIEDRAQLMEQVSGNDWPIKWWFGQIPNGHPIRFPLKVVLHDHGIDAEWVGPLSRQCEVQIIEMLFCTRDPSAKFDACLTHAIKVKDMKPSPKKAQQTTKAGHDIPIPKRGDFFSDLKKAATPEKKSQSRGPKK
jgi:hypothetical protein